MMTDVTSHDMLWQGVMTDMTLLTMCEPGWGWWFNAVTRPGLCRSACGLGWRPLGHHRVLVTPGPASPALACIDLRQLRLRVTRHPAPAPAGGTGSVTGASIVTCERGWQSTQSPGAVTLVTPNRYTGPSHQWHPVVHSPSYCTEWRFIHFMWRELRRYFQTLLLSFLGDGENESAMSKTNPKCSKNTVYLIQWIVKSRLVWLF